MQGPRVLPGIEGLWVILVQLIGAGIDDFVFRQAILRPAHPISAMNQVLADMVAVETWCCGSRVVNLRGSAQYIWC